MNNVFLLGSTSFIGKHISNELKKKYNVTELARPEFDFLKPDTFSKYEFSNSIIIDCINVNNGNASEIENCNVKGFKAFIDYILIKHIHVKYLYFSSISVISKQITAQNVYINSKYLAEKYLIESGLVYHIVRLSYPIGKGENPIRLTSRIIKSIREESTLTLSDIKINITPIECITNHIFSLTQFDDKVITFFSNNIYTPLVEVANSIGSILNIKPNYIVNKSDNHFEPISENPINCSISLETCLKNMI